MESKSITGASRSNPSLKRLNGAEGTIAYRASPWDTLAVFLFAGRAGQIACPVPAQSGPLTSFIPQNFTKKPMQKAEPIILTNYTAQPHLFKLRISTYVKNCTKKYIVKQCECGRVVLPSGCMSKRCENCAKPLGDRRAADVLERFNVARKKILKAGEKFVMLYTTFTLPPNLRYKFIQPAKWKELRARVYSILSEFFGAAFGFEATHPVGDENPESFHPHLNFLWVQKPNFKPFILVDKLKKQFCKALNYKGVVVVYHVYTDQYWRVKRWVKYVTRVFPEYANWLLPLRWFGSFPRCESYFDNLCPICKCAYCTIGYIESDVMSAYQDYGILRGRSPPWEDDKYLKPFKKKKQKGK